VLVYKDDAPKVDPSKVRIDVPGASVVIPPPPDFGVAPQGGQDGSRPVPSGDPLQDQLNQQQDLDRANDDLQKQFGGK